VKKLLTLALGLFLVGMPAVAEEKKPSRPLVWPVLVGGVSGLGAFGLAKVLKLDAIHPYASVACAGIVIPAAVGSAYRGESYFDSNDFYPHSFRLLGFVALDLLFLLSLDPVGHDEAKKLAKAGVGCLLMSAVTYSMLHESKKV